METKNNMGARTAGTIANHPAGFIQTAPNETFNWYGLTKREYFAARALPCFLAGGKDQSWAAVCAVEAADALIEALNK